LGFKYFYSDAEKIRKYHFTRETNKN